MKKQLFNALFVIAFVMVIFGGTSAVNAQSGSTEESSPRRINGSVISSGFSSDLGDYQERFYSIKVSPGRMTVDLSTKGLGRNVTVYIDGAGVNESVGPLAAGGSTPMAGSVTFNVSRKQTLLIKVVYCGEGRYTIDFNGKGRKSAASKRSASDSIYTASRRIFVF